MESWSSRIRPARVSDAGGLALLSGELGHPSTEEQTRRRLLLQRVDEYPL